MKKFIYLFLIVFFACTSEKEKIFNIRITDKVSGNHFADIILDNSGNSYIASFYKNQKNKDYISISKIAPDGKIIWDLGTNSEGRATAITIDKDENIWVTGVFNKVLNLGEYTIDSEGEIGFVIGLNKNGKCLKMSKILGVSSPNNIGIYKNNILINGILGKQINISGTNYSKKLIGNSQFVSLINKDNLNSIWIEEINGQINALNANDSLLIICGSFNNKLIYQSDTLYTESYADNDGFILSLDSLGKKIWWNQIGKKGVIHPDIRSNDAINDLVISGDKIISAGTISIESEYPDKIINEQIIQIWNTSGKMEHSFPISKTYNNKINTLAKSNKNTFWLTGTNESYDNISLESNSYIKRFDHSGNILNEYYPKHDKSFQIRSAASNNQFVHFTGNYKNTFSLNNKTLKTEDKNTIFMISLNQ